MLRKLAPIFTQENVQADEAVCEIKYIPDNTVVEYKLDKYRTGTLRQAMKSVGFLKIQNKQDYVIKSSCDSGWFFPYNRVATIIAVDSVNNWALVVTNSTDMSAQTSKIRVTFHYDNSEFETEFVRRGSPCDSGADIEIYKVKGITKSFQCIEVVDEDIPRKGTDKKIEWMVGFSANNICNADYLSMHRERNVSQLAAVRTEVFFVTEGVSYFIPSTHGHYKTQIGAPIVNAKGQLIGVFFASFGPKEPNFTPKAVYGFHIQETLKECATGSFRYFGNSYSIPTQFYDPRTQSIPIRVSEDAKSFLASRGLKITSVGYDDTHRKPIFDDEGRVGVDIYGNGWMGDTYLLGIKGRSNLIIRTDLRNEKLVKKTSKQFAIPVMHKGVLKSVLLSEILNKTPEYYGWCGIKNVFSTQEDEDIILTVQAIVVRKDDPFCPAVWKISEQQAVCILATGLGSSVTAVGNYTKVPFQQQTSDGKGVTGHYLCPVSSGMGVDKVRKETAAERKAAESTHVSADIPFGVKGMETTFDTIATIFLPGQTGSRKLATAQTVPIKPAHCSLDDWEKSFFGVKTGPSRFEEGSGRPEDSGVAESSKIATRARIGLGPELPDGETTQVEYFRPDGKTRPRVTLTHVVAVEPGKELGLDEIKSIAARIESFYQSEGGFSRQEHIETTLAKAGVQLPVQVPVQVPRAPIVNLYTTVPAAEPIAKKPAVKKPVTPTVWTTLPVEPASFPMEVDPRVEIVRNYESPF
jgi:hypothetical protein